MALRWTPYGAKSLKGINSGDRDVELPHNGRWAQ
jgi:hypothetical protein